MYDTGTFLTIPTPTSARQITLKTTTTSNLYLDSDDRL